MAAAMENTLFYEGPFFLRQRLIFSTLSGKSVKIKKIRHKGNELGINEAEKTFIQMLDKLTNGMLYKINAAGTGLFYRPGILIGGSFELDCGTERAIGYYLEALMYLVPFTKHPTRVVFRGVTHDSLDMSVDLIKHSSFPVLKRFMGTDEGLELKIEKRGAAPGGGGEVVFTSPCRVKLRPINFTDSGKIHRIRGVAWATRVHPGMCNRLVVAARSILNKCVPDVYIVTDHKKGSLSGKSPGFGITLYAMTQNGAVFGVQASSKPTDIEGEPTVAEDLGKHVAKLLVEEIHKGGCVDTCNQGLAATFMALGDNNVSKLQVGTFSERTISTLRHIRDFFGVKFKLDEEMVDPEEKHGGDKVLMTAVGCGYRNVAKVTQ